MTPFEMCVVLFWSPCGVISDDRVIVVNGVAVLRNSQW